jgi:two-component system sensor histidine kinase KdpD
VSAPTSRRRGILRVYLGAAPGVGKTFAMLDEGWRRRERGTDVVIGLVETHGRARTLSQLRDLEVVPRRPVAYRGAQLDEMDVDGLLARAPTVTLVDELAHTNVPGSRNEKRWQDVNELLDAGIDVITTLNIQHLESLNDVIERITGVQQRETVPDAIVRRAEQIELVDMSPEALRRRMAHGNIYPAERVDAALSNYFRPGNLAALRELALLWVADRVEDGLQGYLAAHGITDTWETRERVVVAVTGAPGGDQLVRRAARIAGRLRGGLVGVHILASDGLKTRAGPVLAEQRRLLQELGGSYREIVGDDVPTALLDFARSEKATQLVIGSTNRKRWQEVLRGSVSARIIAKAKRIDIHVMAGPEGKAEPTTSERRPLVRRQPAPRGRFLAWLLTILGLPALTAILVAIGDSVTLATDLLLFLVMTVTIAVLGGLLVSVVAAVGASLLANYYFVEPTGTLTISDPENVVALAIFVVAAVGASVLIDRVGTRSREAMQARAEAGALARASASLIGQPDPVPDLLDQLRAMLSLTGVSLLSNRDDGWIVDASVGDDPPLTPFDGDRWDLSEDGTAVLMLRGPTLRADEQRVLRMFLSNLTVALHARRLQAEAAAAAHLVEADEFRTALLRAVSHDLRTPLASIKASATSLLQCDVPWTQEERDAFAATIDSEADRLNRFVGNLLDMSRLQAGALAVSQQPAYLEDVVAGALGSLPDEGGRVVVSMAELLPPVQADAALLETALANLLTNALAWSPPGTPVRLEAAVVGDRMHVRVVDRGPGIDLADRERVFKPFQRLGDTSNGTGVGLGLAIARGFVEANGGRAILDDTPGGGLTVIVDLPIADDEAKSPAPETLH